MKFYLKSILSLILVISFACKKTQSIPAKPSTEEVETMSPPKTYDFVVSFGSCNKQNNPQPLWDAIAKQNPDIFVWGGDNIYADTEDMNEMAKDYRTQLSNPDYADFLAYMENNVYGTWDDHDYGKNDGGKEWPYKVESQNLFLDFIGVGSTDVRRNRKGVYHAETFDIKDKSLKLIVLDTRYFRSPLKEDTKTKKRYTPWQNGKGTMLGETQWSWLESQLKDSKADYHIIMSSIQFWADEHGFETWGNFPHEVEKLKYLLRTHQPQNVVLLSGDRHISEFSGQSIKGYDYPVIDFTSSGLTHAYSSFTSEPNEDRVGEVVATESFGLLKYDFDDEEVLLEMRNETGVLQEYLLEF